MHLDRRLGDSRKLIESEGWRIDQVVRWKGDSSPAGTARETGVAIQGLVQAFEELETDIVLVVGDRVEAFAAASAAHISGRIVAHVHGGDRALGQVDDSLRHAITKLSHVHFPATRRSADRIRKLGEDAWRIHHVGAPGIDGIASTARSRKVTGRYALLVLHPADADARLELRRAILVLAATRSQISQVVIVYPNNDPGSTGIIRAWKHVNNEDVTIYRNLSRGDYLSLLAHAAVLVGNSSSGIIEAASFGVPVVDVGPRQLGRERGSNVSNVRYIAAEIRTAIRRALVKPRRAINRNVYGGRGTGRRIASVLASLAIDARLRRKLISY
jgi:UDP-N-acetylglucosamine 2-epimerase (non-hydrolysing)/GDP/UDP-N,N'-diacetylbacillosamine 2-epimerase (hydrolysing)